MNSVASEPALIGVDWGTSSFRAFLIGAEGEVIDGVSSPEGIMQVAGQTFEAVLDRLIGPWVAKVRTLPILASGMITSRNGWVETQLCGNASRVPVGLAASISCRMKRLKRCSHPFCHWRFNRTRRWTRRNAWRRDPNYRRLCSWS